MSRENRGLGFGVREMLLNKKAGRLQLMAPCLININTNYLALG